MNGVVGPGGTVGILGGGQLARMLAMATARMGMRAHVYSPEADPPAAAVARCACGDWSDAEALAAFADAVDVVTLEFENAPAEALDALAGRRPVWPDRRALATAQDRLTEKTFIAGLDLPVAPFAAVDDAAGLQAALARIGAPAILKTRRLGYDGKGQARLAGPQDAAAALEALAGAPAILEGQVDFAMELSVIVARGRDGAMRCYDPARNVHENGVLRQSIVPAGVDARTADRAQETARRIAQALGYVGVMGVELFLARDGALIVNEIAPRVHNSGHWTMEACAVDQFAQHVRAVCGWPLGDPRRHADAVIENLLGDEADAWRALAAQPGAAPHLYGKAEARPGRKMGHVTRLSPLSREGRADGSA
jgi:5-(carboxyamino)imidazole ribonucleotide synthase